MKALGTPEEVANGTDHHCELDTDKYGPCEVWKFIGTEIRPSMVCPYHERRYRSSLRALEHGAKECLGRLWNQIPLDDEAEKLHN